MTGGEGDDGGEVAGPPGHEAPDAPDAASGLRLRVHPGALAVVRLPAGAAVPAWAERPPGAGDPGHGPEPLHAVVRTAEETSLVLAAARVPRPGDADAPAPAPGTVEDDFRALSVAGPLDFALVGILARLCDALARAAVPVFAVSTFDTDWLLVRSDRLEAAIAALRAAGARVDDGAA